MNDEEMNEMIDNLVIHGYLELSGIDSASGEFLYRVTPELKELIPEMAKNLQNIFLEELNNLWVKGFVSMDFAEKDPSVKLTDMAFDEERVESLTFEERNTLNLVKEAMQKDEE